METKKFELFLFFSSPWSMSLPLSLGLWWPPLSSVWSGHNWLYFAGRTIISKDTTILYNVLVLNPLPSMLRTFPVPEMYNIVQEIRVSSSGIANMLLAGGSGVLNPEMEWGLSLPQTASFFWAPPSLKIKEHRVHFLPKKHRGCEATKLKMSGALCLL